MVKPLPHWLKTRYTDADVAVHEKIRFQQWLQYLNCSFSLQLWPCIIIIVIIIIIIFLLLATGDDTCRSAYFSTARRALTWAEVGTRLFVPWTFRTIDVSYHLWTFRTMDDSYHGLFVPSLDFSYRSYHGLFVPSSDFSYRRRNSTAPNENGLKNNIRKPKRRQIEAATYTGWAKLNDATLHFCL